MNRIRIGLVPHRSMAVAAAALALIVCRATAAAQVSVDSLPPSGRGTPFTVGYYIGEGRPGDKYRPADRDLAKWAIEAWQRAIGPGVSFAPAEEDRALIRVYWVGPLGGQYGEMRPLAVGGTSGAAVFVRPDTDSLGDAIARRAQQDALFRESIVYLTCLHEIGHALGLPHTADFRDIMYFFGYGGDIVGYFGRYRGQLRERADIARVAGYSDADVRAVRERFRH